MPVCVCYAVRCVVCAWGGGGRACACVRVCVCVCSDYKMPVCVCYAVQCVVCVCACVRVCVCSDYKMAACVCYAMRCTHAVGRIVLTYADVEDRRMCMVWYAMRTYSRPHRAHVRGIVKMRTCVALSTCAHVCGIANIYANTFKCIQEGVNVKWSSVAGIKGVLLTRSCFWFRLGSIKSNDKTHKKTPCKQGICHPIDKNECRDNKEGHSRLEHRTIATAGQCLVILVCITAV